MNKTKKQRFEKVVETKQSISLILGLSNLFCSIVIIIYFVNSFVAGALFTLNFIGFIFNMNDYYDKENRKVYWRKI